MRTHLCAAALLAAAITGCTSTIDPSNQLDSGVDCNTLPPDAGGPTPGIPAGSGSVTGAFSFSVGASYENRNTTMSVPIVLGDGGAPPSVTGSYLSIVLYGGPVPCGVSNASDGGFYPWAWLILTDPQGGSYAAGDYPVVADGGAAAQVYLLGPTDGGYQFGKGSSGAVHLSSTQVCSLDGTFDVVVKTDDGGMLPVSGTFAPGYCQQ